MLFNTNFIMSTFDFYSELTPYFGSRIFFNGFVHKYDSSDKLIYSPIFNTDKKYLFKPSDRINPLDDLGASIFRKQKSKPSIIPKTCFKNQEDILQGKNLGEENIFSHTLQFGQKKFECIFNLIEPNSFFVFREID